MCVCVCVCTLKWIDQPENLLSSYLFFSTRFSDVLSRLQEVNGLFECSLFVFIVTTVLIGLWLFFISGFVSVNVQSELIVRDKILKSNKEEKNPESICTYMNTNIHADTQTHRILSGKKWKFARTKVCHGRLTRTGYSQTQNLELNLDPQPYQNSCHYKNQREH